MTGRSTMEVINLMRQITKYYNAKKRDQHMIFIDLKKAHDRVSRKVFLVGNDKEGHSQEIY